jgi:hypothetical protein
MRRREERGRRRVKQREREMRAWVKWEEGRGGG